MSSASMLRRWLPGSGTFHCRSTRVVTTLCLLAPMALGWACQKPALRGHIALRFIEEDPGELLDLARLRAQSPSLSWEFLEGQMPEPWRARGRAEPARDGLRLFSDRAQIQARVKIDSAEVQSVTIEIEPTTSHAAFLLWTQEGREFAAERQIRCKIEAGGPEPRSCRFDLSEHPLWQGEIDRLRLSFNFREPGNVTLRSMTAHSWSIDPDILPSLLGKAVKVERSHDVRNVLLSVPGFEIKRQLRIPEKASLHFATGELWHPGTAITFEVAIAVETNETVLFERSVPVGASAESWHPGSVDLEPFAGKDAEIILRTRGEVDPKRLRGLALWANPEILAASREAEPKNVVLISIDTLRADHMSLYGYERPTTPHLQEWIQGSGVFFSNTVAQASWTLPSHTSMLSGISALRHGVNHNSPVPLALELLPETLRRAGYRTLATTGGAYLHPAYRLAQGFDRFEYWPGKGEGPSGDAEMEHLLRRATSWLEEGRDLPFFLFFHTYEVHHRTSPREPYFSDVSSLEMPKKVKFVAPKPKFEEGFKKSRRYEIGGQKPGPLPAELAELPNDIYDSRIAYMDQKLQLLLQKIDDLGLSDNTLVVLTSDHGELLGEHGLYGHLSLYEENLIVPLLIAGPGIPVRKEPIENQVRSIDIVPTILDQLGLAGNGDIEGISLRELIEKGEERISREAWSYASVSNFGLSLRYANRLKLIFNNAVWAPIRGETEVYNLTGDPEEQHSATAEGEEIDPLKARLATQYLANVPGLRLQIDNPGATELALAFEGSVLRIAGIKSVDLSCDCAVWDHNRLLLDLPPGRSTTLVFEDIKGQDQELLVKAQGTAEAPGLRLDLTTLDESAQIYTLSAEGWHREPATSSPPTGSTPTLSVWFQGARQAVDVPEDSDSELRDRLRALGYID